MSNVQHITGSGVFIGPARWWIDDPLLSLHWCLRAVVFLALALMGILSCPALPRSRGVLILVRCRFLG